MATMRGAFFDGDGGMEVRSIPRPEVGRGDVIVRVRCVGICGSDLQMNVDKTEPDRLPAGHEVCRRDRRNRRWRRSCAHGRAGRRRDHRSRSRLYDLLVLSPGPVSRMSEHGSERRRWIRRVHEAPRDRMLSSGRPLMGRCCPGRTSGGIHSRRSAWADAGRGSGRRSRQWQHWSDIHRRSQGTRGRQGNRNSPLRAAGYHGQALGS